MSAFDKLPPPPQGNTSPEIWQRAFHAAVKQMVCHGVLGGEKIQHPDGGYSIKVNQAGKTQALPWHPFKIYNWPNGADTWRTFAVRAGLVGLRPKWPSAYDNYPPGDPAFVGQNWETQFLVNNGTDLVGVLASQSGTGFTSNFVDLGYTVNTVNVTGNADFAGVEQSIFVIDTDEDLNYSDDPYNLLRVGFWIAVTNSETEIKFEVKARLSSGTVSAGGLSSYPWPHDDPDIIPIGVALTQKSGGENPLVPIGAFDIQQRLFDHVVNRYGLGQAGGFRGNWDDDALSGQIFYPGDWVVRIVPDSSFNYEYQYRWVGPAATSTSLSDFLSVAKLRSYPLT